MSEEGLEIVRGIYCRTLLLDPDLLAALGEHATPDTEFDFTDVYPDGRVVKGMKRMRQIAANWPWGDLHFEPERFFDTDGERVVVFIRATATGVGSGGSRPAPHRPRVHVQGRSAGALQGVRRSEEGPRRRRADRTTALR